MPTRRDVSDYPANQRILHPQNVNWVSLMDLIQLAQCVDGKGERVSGGRNGVDCFGGVGIIVVGEFGDRVLECARKGRRRKGHDQQQ